MPNFAAKLRADYRDVEGLVLSCGRDDIEEDPSHAGYALRWRNRAAGLKSIPEFRQYGDAVTYVGGKFSDPQQLSLPLQPRIVLTGGGQKRLLFVRASSQFLECIAPADLGQADGLLTVFTQFERGVDTTFSQGLFGHSGGKLDFVRISVSGNSVANIGFFGTSRTGDLPTGTHMVRNDGVSVIRSQENDAETSAATTETVRFTGGSKIFVGKDHFSHYLDGYLDGLHVWSRGLSPLERDFVWNSVNEDGISYAVQSRAVVGTQVWTDVTGDANANQLSRVRSAISVPERFNLVSTAGAYKRIQIAASIGGLVLPDSALGGNLFTIDWVVVPGNPLEYPQLYQDAGWSAVFDCRLRKSGHYVARIDRTNGGAVYIHFDVDGVP